MPEPCKIKNKRISVVGRFIEKKGIDIAVRALALLDPEYTIDIIGDGEQKDFLHQIAIEYKLENRIRWHGELPLEEVLKIVANSRFFWHPARRAADGNAEGIPQALIYALALQRICIATNSDHIRDLIENMDGSVLIEPDNPEELALATLAMEPLHASIDRSEIVQQYGIDSQLKNWLNIYDLF